VKITAIYYSSRFFKKLAKLSDEELARLGTIEKIFKADCFDRRLNTHKLKGKLKNYWAFSLTHSQRIIFRFLKKGTVAFVDIGSHHIYR
jgi:mRNA-degrading endonuclease YafQ of YafQ-DinJ toxin-antitoxin module